MFNIKKLNINTEIHNSTGSISTKYWEEDKKAKIINMKDKFKDTFRLYDITILI